MTTRWVEPRPVCALLWCRKTDRALITVSALRRVMNSLSRRLEGNRRMALALPAALVGLVLAACSTPAPPSRFPPSASDLVLLKSTRLCDRKTDFLQRREGASPRREGWGSGEEVRISANRSESGAEESFFFDEDGVLVGALFAFPGGQSLKPYPVLRQTLSELKPALEFYLNVAQLADRANLDPSTLYETGDEKSTTQYIVLGAEAAPTLLMASFSLDPYAKLLSPYRKEFLARIQRGEKTKSGQRPGGPGAEDKESFPAVQQFARGQTAHLSYCGSRNYDVAAEAYAKAIKRGFSNKTWLAEAHHKLGLALEGKGQFEQAKVEMQQSLTVRPNTPEVLNNLGTVYKQLGDRDRALEAFEKSVTLRPNYPLARYNLAEAYETVNPKRAISEYETYLALVEGVPEEADRAVRARQRVNELSR